MVTKGLLHFIFIYLFILLVLFYVVADVLILLCYFFFFQLLFPAQRDFQGKDAMWLHQKATQRTQSAAAIISLILLSYLTAKAA